MIDSDVERMMIEMGASLRDAADTSIENRRILVDKLLELTGNKDGDLFENGAAQRIWRELKLKMINDSID